jgi:hypothetical protein
MVMIQNLLIAIWLGVVCPPPPASAISAHLIKEQNVIKKLIDDFTSNDWQKVHLAESALESRQAEAIPALIELLDRDEKVELHNTADLIYPGAKEFYGHGWILDYDVDWISVRAGWALENLTFQNFGFREGVINEAYLFNAVIKRQGNVQLTDPSKTATVKKQIRAQASSRAKTWWQKSQSSWNRFAAVLESLRSDDPVRQQWTLNWIRNGKTKCDGLNVDSFKKYIVPEAERLLKSSNQSVRDQAKYLLDDRKGWWQKYKTESK